jgi:deazaflavin-dependent oxidoreductase (nitroreductase family)
MAPSAASTRRLWLIVNTITRPLAGYAPWWVLLETTGRRTGARRRTPLAGAPLHGATISLLAGYGDESAFVKNIRANPEVRIKRRGRWLRGSAELLGPTPDDTGQLGTYARNVLMRVGTNPTIVKITIR